VIYSLAVYFFHDRASALVFISIALALIVGRLILARSPIARLWRLPLGIAAGALILLALRDQRMATKAYPVIISLAASATFAWSLLRPPSLIERFARIRRSQLPEGTIAYCRKVTVLWAAWLFFNACIAAALGEWSSLKLWTLWTGILSYVVSGSLLVGEMIFRRLFIEKRNRP
jgi:uncharacterized membrane protein